MPRATERITAAREGLTLAGPLTDRHRDAVEGTIAGRLVDKCRCADREAVAGNR